MVRSFYLGKPPAVLNGDDPGVNADGQFGPLPYLSSRRFDIDPVAFLNGVLLGCFRVNLNNRVGVLLAQPGYLAVLGVEKDRRPGARC